MHLRTLGFLYNRRNSLTICVSFQSTTNFSYFGDSNFRSSWSSSKPRVYDNYGFRPRFPKLIFIRHAVFLIDLHVIITIEVSLVLTFLRCTRGISRPFALALPFRDLSREGMTNILVFLLVEKFFVGLNRARAESSGGL